MSTVRIFRIVHRKYAGDPYSGKGGLYGASRWSSPGHLVSFASETLALAALEKIVGAGSLTRLKEMVYASAELKERAIWKPSHVELPDGWARRPPGHASRAFGDRWRDAEETVALRVPSVIVPEGYNYVLNPTHPDFQGAFTANAPRPLELDPRITERLSMHRASDDE